MVSVRIPNEVRALDNVLRCTLTNMKTLGRERRGEGGTGGGESGDRDGRRNRGRDARGWSEAAEG